MLLELSKRALLSQALDITGCGRALRASRIWQGALILNYHRIGDPCRSMLDRNLWSATQEDFDYQVGLAKQDFDVIGLDDLEQALRERHGRFVMFTFDDGYRDNYTHGFPVLRSHGVPATFFVTTGFLDHPQVPWWDEIAWMVRSSPLSALDVNRWTSTPVPFDDPQREIAIRRLLNVYKGLPGESTDDYLEFLSTALKCGRCPDSVAQDLWMTWDMVREMRLGGMTFGGHTVTHPILANISAEQQDWEISECKRRLVEELGEPVFAFSFPVGGRSSFNSFTRTSLTQHGFRLAFSYYGNYVRLGHKDLHCISRAAIETDINQTQFRAVVTLPQLFA
ncbi:MAG: polysaccharide deacetylase family protein [Planctomycetes bacterium]|nr:polysaccharide deacetylase family protein [Planctomycetota bacterium]